MQSYVFLNWP